MISLPFHWICTLITHKSVGAENCKCNLRKTFTKLWQHMLYTRGWNSIFFRHKITGTKNNNLTWYSAKSMNSFVFNLWFVHKYLAFYTSNNKFDFQNPLLQVLHKFCEKFTSNFIFCICCGPKPKTWFCS